MNLVAVLIAFSAGMLIGTWRRRAIKVPSPAHPSRKFSGTVHLVRAPYDWERSN